VNPDCYRGSKQ